MRNVRKLATDPHVVSIGQASLDVLTSAENARQHRLAEIEAALSKPLPGGERAALRREYLAMTDQDMRTNR